MDKNQFENQGYASITKIYVSRRIENLTINQLTNKEKQTFINGFFREIAYSENLNFFVYGKKLNAIVELFFKFYSFSL